jgi:hypothetical protein
MEARKLDKELDEKITKYRKVQTETMVNIYAQADLSLFREDIDPKRAMDIIKWALFGYTESLVSEVPENKAGEVARENYDLYLDEFKEILGILRLCFYKK